MKKKIEDDAMLKQCYGKHSGGHPIILFPATEDTKCPLCERIMAGKTYRSKIKTMNYWIQEIADGNMSFNELISHYNKILSIDDMI